MVFDVKTARHLSAATSSFAADVRYGLRRQDRTPLERRNLRLRRPMWGEALPRRQSFLRVGLGPWFGLGPQMLRAKPEPGA